MPVLQDDGVLDLRHPGDQVQTAVRGERCSGSEPHRRIVVARGRDDDRTGRADGLEARIAHRDRVGTRDRTVVDVAGYDDHIDVLLGDEACDRVEGTTLVGEKVDTVEGAPDVPVGGVQDAHGHRR